MICAQSGFSQSQFYIIMVIKEIIHCCTLITEQIMFSRIHVNYQKYASLIQHIVSNCTRSRSALSVIIITEVQLELWSHWALIIARHRPVEILQLSCQFSVISIVCHVSSRLCLKDFEFLMQSLNSLIFERYILLAIMDLEQEFQELTTLNVHVRFYHMLFRL